MVEGPMLLVILVIAIAFIVVMTAKVKMNAFLVLLITALGTALAAGMDPPAAIQATLDGFGGLMTCVGVVIICGCIIGTFLEKSRATITMANTVLRVISRAKAALAMGITGCITSCTVFCDSGFIILSPLNKVLSKKTGISYTTMTVALSAGLLTSHSMIPPASGPIAASANVNADIGLVIIFGLITAIPSVFVTYLFARWIGKRIFTEPDIQLDEAEEEKNLPGIIKSFSPIVVPIILISLKSIADFPSHPFGEGTTKTILDSLGVPSIAMLIGVFFAFRLVPKWSVEYINGWVVDGVRNSALIVAITTSGGALGNVLRATEIGPYLGESLAQFNLGIFLPFLIAAAMKIAQGSGTVSLITASAIVGPMLGDLGYTTPAQVALTVTAIGAGSTIVSHANDSYFWVVQQFSGLDVSIIYKAHTTITLVLGATAMTTVYLISLFVM